MLNVMFNLTQAIGAGRQSSQSITKGS